MRPSNPTSGYSARGNASFGFNQFYDLLDTHHSCRVLPLELLSKY